MSQKYCDGVARRDFIKVGALGATGLTLSNYLNLVEAGETQEGKAKSAIFINLAGGPSHMDSFDMKPDAPDTHRGEYNPIKTKVSGVEFCEHMPKLAKITDKFAIVRGVSHTLAAHQLGRKFMNTGNRPLPSLEFPTYGSVVCKEMSAPENLPPYVAIPNTNADPGFLGIQYAALNTNATPQFGKPFSVRGISLGGDLTVEKFNKRRDLLTDLDTAFKGYEKKLDLINGMDRFSQQAHALITSDKAREAFDISKEPKNLARHFEGSKTGANCLLAARLIEAGTRFVTLNFGGWDTHQANFDKLKSSLLPNLDTCVSGLLLTLEEKGLLETTTVVVTGEFGRTPKINQRGGRDHWPRAMFVLFAGGGIKGGQAVGKSDDKGMGPAGKGYTPGDIAATFYHTLGIDINKEYHTNTGRPIRIVSYGNAIRELVG